MNPWKSPNASLAHTYKPPSSGKREDNSLITNAPGTKKKSAAITQRLMEEVPLWPAAAIQRGPRTVAMLNSNTSQKPIVLRNCDLGSDATAAELLTGSRPAPGSAHPAPGNPAGTDPWNFRIRPRSRTLANVHPAEKLHCRPVAGPDAYRA